MNKRNLDQIELELVTTLDTKGGGLFANLFVELSFNGSIVHSHGDVFDYDLLRTNMLEDGDYFLITCDCGVPGCAGRFKGVRLEFDDKYVNWEDLDTDEKWIFELESLKVQIEEINKKEKELIEQFVERGVEYQKLNEIWN